MAREIGFLTPGTSVNVERFDIGTVTWVHTCDGTTSATSSKMVDDGGITLDHAIDTQVAPEARIRNLFVFETPDGSFDGLGSSSARFEESHADASGADRKTLDVPAVKVVSKDLRVACLKMYFLIHHAVVACARVYEDRRNRLLGCTSPRVGGSTPPSRGVSRKLLVARHCRVYPSVFRCRSDDLADWHSKLLLEVEVIGGEEVCMYVKQRASARDFACHRCATRLKRYRQREEFRLPSEERRGRSGLG